MDTKKGGWFLDALVVANNVLFSNNGIQKLNVAAQQNLEKYISGLMMTHRETKKDDIWVF